MRTYPEYKDSGVEWIGEIPRGWEFKSTKFHFLYKKGSQGQMLTSTFLGENPGDYPVYSGQTENKGVLGTWSEYEFDYPNGVIFVTTVGAKSMTNRLVRGKFSLSQNCLILIPRDDQIDPSSINYFLHYDFLYRKELLPRILQPSLRMEDIDQYKILVPPLSEQKQISDYLDQKTQQIDDLIEKTEQKIELLEEQRSSLINQCVTKGLDPNVEMKDSGVEWIGDIPKEWDLKKVKYLGDIKSGDGITNTELSDDGEIPVYGGNGIVGYYDEFNSSHTVIVIGRVGEKCGNIHLVYEKCWISDNSLILTLRDDTNYPWVSICLNSRDLNKIRNQSSQPLITSTQVKNESIPFPSENQRKQISDYLDKETSKIDQIVDIETKRIDLLKEYRQSLISNVVTGKIDVRDEVVQ